VPSKHVWCEANRSGCGQLASLGRARRLSTRPDLGCTEIQPRPAQAADALAAVSTAARLQDLILELWSEGGEFLKPASCLPCCCQHTRAR